MPQKPDSMPKYYKKSIGQSLGHPYQLRLGCPPRLFTKPVKIYLEFFNQGNVGCF